MHCQSIVPHRHVDAVTVRLHAVEVQIGGSEDSDIPLLYQDELKCSRMFLRYTDKVPEDIDMIMRYVDSLSQYIDTLLRYVSTVLECLTYCGGTIMPCQSTLTHCSGTMTNARIHSCPLHMLPSIQCPITVTTY